MLKTKPHIPLSEEEKASKAKLYRKIAVISLVILLLSLLSAFISRPQNLNVDTSQIKMVSVKVVDAESKHERWGKAVHIHYYYTIEYEGNEYDMGPLSNGVYDEGATYMFYKAGDEFYPTEQDAVYGLENQSTSIIYKISLPLAFIAFIVSISYFFSYLRIRKQ